MIALCHIRIEHIEFLDEQELLIQLLQHYCLSCGYSDIKAQGIINNAVAAVSVE